MGSGGELSMKTHRYPVPSPVGRHLQTDHSRGMSTFAVNFGDFSDALITSKMSFLQIFLMSTVLLLFLHPAWWRELVSGEKNISEASEEGTEAK